MINRYKKYIFIGITAVLIAYLLTDKAPQEPPEVVYRDYAAIEKEKVLRAVTEYNRVSYFVEEDTVSGFNYELLSALVARKGWKIEFTPEMSVTKRAEGLLSGKYDLIADHIPVTREIRDSLLLTEPVSMTRQVLVQRITEGEEPIRSLLELGNQTVHVVKGAASIYRLKNLADEIGEHIHIEEVEKYGPEQLLAMVAHGDIGYAVCEESIALASREQFPQLDINTNISFTQFYSWGMLPHATQLADSLNHWLMEFKQKKAYKTLVDKYYPNR